MMDKYAIRRAILRALYKYENPQELNTILWCPYIMLVAAKVTLDNEDIQDIRTEWNYLLDKGYLVSVPGYDDYAKLSSDIRAKLDAADQLGGMNPLMRDERLYGPEALR